MYNIIMISDDGFYYGDFRMPLRFSGMRVRMTRAKVTCPKVGRIQSRDANRFRCFPQIRIESLGRKLFYNTGRWRVNILNRR